MKVISLLKAFIVALKFRFHFVELLNESFPKLWYSETLKRYIVFCPHCGEYICEDGLCSNPWCPEKLNDSEHLPY